MMPSSSPPTVGDALRRLYTALAPHSETAVLDAQTALARLMARPRAWVLAHTEARLSPQQVRRLQGWVQRLARGEPLPYVLGEWEFYGRPFYVTPAVLIPRPETETLVEVALATLPPGRAARVVDVGTGSGCIAFTLALERPGWQVWATDRSWEALQVARRNRARHGLEDRVPLVQAHLLAPLPGPWDLVVANLPYIPSGELAGLRVSRWEPRLALNGGPDGTALLRDLLAQAWPRLAKDGRLLLELAPQQAEPLAGWVRERFPGARVVVHSDLRGHPRVLEVKGRA